MGARRGAGQGRGRIGRRRPVTWAVLIVLALVTACGTATSATPTVSELADRQLFYQSNYLGHVVTVRGRVADVRDPRTFDLVGDEPADLVLVMTDQPVAVQPDQTVLVTGTVGQIHTSAPSEKVPYRQRDLYNAYTTNHYLYHATLR